MPHDQSLGYFSLRSQLPYRVLSWSWPWHVKVQLPAKRPRSRKAIRPVLLNGRTMVTSKLIRCVWSEPPPVSGLTP